VGCGGDDVSVTAAQGVPGNLPGVWVEEEGRPRHLLDGLAWWTLDPAVSEPVVGPGASHGVSTRRFALGGGIGLSGGGFFFGHGTS